MNQQMGASTGRAYQERAQLRFALSIKTLVALGDGREIAVQLRDISTGGFAGRSIEDMEPGSRVTLLLPDTAPIEAEIVWQIGPTVGARFTASVPPGTVTALIDASPGA